MDEDRKNAYRWLLYCGMLRIRILGWGLPRGWRSLLPAYWRESVQRLRSAGDEADLLHNLALFAALDFEGFDETWFWRNIDTRTPHWPGDRLMAYREQFDRRLADLRELRTALKGK